MVSMTAITHQDLLEIKVSLARIEERLAAYQETQDALAKRIAETHDALSKRIDALEANQTWAVRAIVGVWIAGAGVVAFGAKKIGL